jgi:plastocyanin
MPRTRAAARLVLAGLCAVALVACGSSGSSSSSGATSSSSSSSGATSGSSSSGSSSSEAGSTASTITIKDFSFTTPDSVSPGATITVDNKDGTLHTVTSDDGDAFDDTASAGTSTFTAPTKPGSYPFHCNIHPSMHGTLVVR